MWDFKFRQLLTAVGLLLKETIQNPKSPNPKSELGCTFAAPAHGQGSEQI